MFLFIFFMSGKKYVCLVKRFFGMELIVVWFIRSYLSCGVVEV